MYEERPCSGSVRDRFNEQNRFNNGNHNIRPINVCIHLITVLTIVNVDTSSTSDICSLDTAWVLVTRPTVVFFVILRRIRFRSLFDIRIRVHRAITAIQKGDDIESRLKIPILIWTMILYITGISAHKVFETGFEHFQLNWASNSCRNLSHAEKYKHFII